MPTFEVPGAILSYTTFTPTNTRPERSPHILLISCSPGTAAVYAALAPQLAQVGFNATTYSRRGYTGSRLVGPQDYSIRLATDADDAAALLKHVTSSVRVSHDEMNGKRKTSAPKAFIFGASAGAIIALELLKRHPDIVVDLVGIHEPPICTVYPEADRHPEYMDALYKTYRDQGVKAALEIWFGLFNDPWEAKEGMRSLMDPDSGDGDMRADLMYWCEREFVQYPFPERLGEKEIEEMTAEGKRVRSLVLLMAGEKSMNNDGSPETLGAKASGIIAKMAGKELVIMPGGHLGFVNYAETFAKKLCELFLQEETVESN